MAVERVDYKGGAGRAKIVCDDCEKSEVVPCNYLGNHNGASNEARPNESQARAKALAMGWAYVKGKLRCHECEAKRKVVPMKQAKTEVPEPTKKERIQIFAMLADVYDVDAGRYNNGDTDETVADVLGVRPGFVAQIREAEFGPDGGNEDIEGLTQELHGQSKAITEAMNKLNEAKQDLDFLMRANEAHRTQLDKIRKAVGPRILKAAGAK